MWLAHVLHARIGWWLTLVAASCLLTYVKRQSIGWLVAATALSLIALLLYEGQLGVFLAFGLLVIVSQRAVPRRTRLMLLIPIGLNGLYMIWRSVGFRVVGIQDQYLSQLTLNIGDLANRLRLGFQVLWWSWTGPVGRWLQIESNWLIVLILLGTLSGLVLAAMGWAGRKSVVETDSEKESVKADWYALLVGAGFIVAGYFPTISLYEPNLNGVFTRVNFYALPGAALCLVTGLSLMIRLVAKGQTQRWRSGFITALVALIGLGMVIQVWVRQNAEAAWQEQRGIWAQLFELAPQFQPDTVVCFVLPDYQDQLQFSTWWRTPLSADWEVSAALRLLYNNPALRGEIVLPKVTGYGEATLLPAGVRNPWTGKVSPYASTVFLTYDKSRRQLTLMTDVAHTLGLDWPVVNYDPDRHILQSRPPQVALRRLIVNP
jgi:hypothetical protein